MMPDHRCVLKLSVAVVVHKSDLTMLKANLKLLFAASEFLERRVPATLSVFVIDNSLCDSYFSDLISVLESLETPDNLSLRTVRLNSNRGYGDANNQVLDLMQSEYHLVLNPDVGLSSDALYEAVRFMSTAQDVSLLTPAIVERSGHVTSVAKRYPDCFTLFLRYFNVGWISSIFSSRLKRYSMSSASLSGPCEVELAGGCFMFFRVADFISVGGFDTRFFMYFEDFDLSLRVRDAGRICYVPAVRVSHEGGGVGRKRVNHHFYFMVSAFRFFNKNGWKLF